MGYSKRNNNIYRVDPIAGTYGILLANPGAFRFNGLLFDDVNNRLLFTDDLLATTSAISAIDLATNNVTTLITNTDFGWLDGLTVDHQGNYYVSCWSNPNLVYRYDPNFTTTDIASTGHNDVDHFGAADIYFHMPGAGKVKNENRMQDNDGILVVPNMNANTVDFIPFSQLSTYDSEISIPNEFQLHQNYPNPFNPNTSINYDITEELFVNITIYNLLGAEIAQLVNKVEQPGIKTISWDGRDSDGNQVKSGVYVYRLVAGNYSETKKMVFLK